MLVLLRSMFLAVASLCIIAFEAPFYGNTCEKGKCPPGHRLERNAKVATSETKCDQTV